MSRRFELSVTPKRWLVEVVDTDLIASLTSCYRMLNVSQERRWWVSQSKSQKWFCPRFSIVGLGLKALPRLFRGPAKVSAYRGCFKKPQLESLCRIPFDITTFAIHFVHVLEYHRPRMVEWGGEGWKCAMTVPWLFIACCWYPAFSIIFTLA